MLLAVDVGNTHIVMGIIDNGEIKSSVRLSTIANSTKDEYAIKIADLLNYMHVEISSIEVSYISTVVPQLAITLSSAIESIVGVKSTVVSPNIELGYKISIDEPSSVAGDLLVGAAGAIGYYKTPIIVIDMGTATTVTVLDKNNEFIGGSIIPGVMLGLTALSSGTALLPSISLNTPDAAIGRNTIDCMRSGAVFASADMIDGTIDRFEKELGYKCNYLATGGLAKSVVKNCRHDIVCDDDLLLKGLWKLYELNK